MDYVAVDLETTGLDPKKDKIIEIGAVRVQNDVVVGQFHTMVNPRRVLSEHIVELTGITDVMVESAPDGVDILPEFLDFCGELPLLGHRVIFDYSFLKRLVVFSGGSFEREGIDTLALCRRFMPETEKKNLEAACAFFGIRRQGAHRALGDAIDAHQLFQKLSECYEAEYPAAFLPSPLIYKVKREQPASKRQKEDLRDLLKYHRIDLPMQIEYLTRNEISRIKDQIILQYGRMK